MIHRFPKFPFCELRDDRPPRLMSRSRLIEIVQRAESFGSEIADLFGSKCVLELLRKKFPKNASWLPDNEYFVTEAGNMEGIEAYVDFDGGTKLLMREEVFIGLFSEQPDCSHRRNSRETIGHEFGHINLLSHRRKLIARARASGFASSKRAARDRSLDGRRSEFTIKARNLDLEEEADCYCFALLVPISRLTGQETVEGISSQYDVSRFVALQAALLAKDYRRSLFLAEQKLFRKEAE